MDSARYGREPKPVSPCRATSVIGETMELDFGGTISTDGSRVPLPSLGGNGTSTNCEAMLTGSPREEPLSCRGVGGDEVFWSVDSGPALGEHPAPLSSRRKFGSQSSLLKTSPFRSPETSHQSVRVRRRQPESALGRSR